MGLGADEVRRFNEAGYLVRERVFSPADLASIRGALERVVDREVRSRAAEGKLRHTFPDEDLDNRLARIYEKDAEAGRAIYGRVLGKGGGGYHGPEMFDMLTHPGLPSCVESLVGPEIVGSSVYRVRVKLPEFAHGEVPWHQDSGYLLSHCDRYLIVTCWIPLVDATVANGCLYVVPGAHRGGILRHCTGGKAGYLEIPEETVPAGAIPIEMRAGGVLFMTNLTPHASFRNSTRSIRWSLDLRYQSAEAPNNVDEPPETYTPERDPVTMACYPPEADFVIRSVVHPERVVRTAQVFERVRARYENAKPYMPGRGWLPIPERTGGGR